MCADQTSLQVHDRLVKNGPDVTCLLARGFSAPEDNSDPNLKTQGQALSCFQVRTSLRILNTPTNDPRPGFYTRSERLQSQISLHR